MTDRTKTVLAITITILSSPIWLTGYLVGCILGWLAINLAYMINMMKALWTLPNVITASFKNNFKNCTNKDSESNND